MYARSRALALPLAVGLAVGGCAAPVRYYSGERPAIATTDMPRALAYLQALRAQYQAAVEKQMRDERYLTNALVGAGAVALGLALGNVNGSAIAGTALGAGTAYTLGNINLPRQTVLVHQAGIDALNCTEKAVLPLYIDGADLAKLRKKLDDAEDGLVALRGQLAAKVLEGEAMIAQAASAASARPRLEAAVVAGEKILASSATTMRAGREFIALGARGSREVVATVTGIDTAVARAIVAGTPDLSAVPGLVAGLAGTAGSFVPSAGIDTSTLDGLDKKKRDGVKAMTSAPKKDPLDEKAIEVLDAAKAVATRNEEVRSLLPTGPVVWPEDAFKSCGVAQVVSALSASTTGLRFSVGVDARQEFEIYGGLKPYFVRIDGPMVDGLSVRSPVRFDNLAELTVVGSKVSQSLETQLRVVDSSPTPRVLSIPVSIAASAPGGGGKLATVPSAAGGSAAPIAPATTAANKPASTAPAAPAAPTATSPASPGSDAAKLGAVGNFQSGGRTFSLIGQPVDDGTKVAVTVKCPDGDVQVRRSDLARDLQAKADITQPTRHLEIKTVPPTCAKN